ncbi:hypothetical protein [Parasphingorhabdus sp.]|uniref:hypothetical protein n=1 Tax=Parasphingorhabdus sp. TaxID=2709688 RepID=UPI00326787A1
MPKLYYCSISVFYRIFFEIDLSLIAKCERNISKMQLEGAMVAMMQKGVFP